MSDNQKKLQKEKEGIDKNLSNSNFTKRAPKELIDQNTISKKIEEISKKRKGSID